MQSVSRYCFLFSDILVLAKPDKVPVSPGGRNLEMKQWVKLTNLTEQVVILRASLSDVCSQGVSKEGANIFTISAAKPLSMKAPGARFLPRTRSRADSQIKRLAMIGSLRSVEHSASCRWRL